MADKWIVCGECKYLAECKAGLARIQGVDVNSRIYSEIGCFNYEQYLIHLQGKQLKLF